MLTRRSLLRLGGITVILCASGGLAISSVRGWRGFASQVIQNYVPGIEIDTPDLDALVEDYISQNRNHNITPFRLAVLNIVYPIVRSPVGYSMRFLPFMQPLIRLERRIIRSFFFATDFLDGPYQSGRMVTFIRSSDAYVMGCTNRFAQLE
jgi:hypothetical protein